MTHEFDARRAEWIAREELAERMIPLIGGLYRDHGVVTSIHGRRLINRSAIDLLKAHRFARQAGDVELDLARHDAGARGAARDRSRPRLDRRRAARLPVRRRRRRGRRPRSGRLRARRTRVRHRGERPGRRACRRPRHPEPMSCSTASAASGACSPASSSPTPAAATDCACARSSCARGATTTSIKRASLLRRDSVHGPFQGTIDVDEEANTILANGTLIQVIYSNDPADDRLHRLRHRRRDRRRQHRPLARRRGALAAPALAPGVARVLLTAPGKGASRTSCTASTTLTTSSRRRHDPLGGLVHDERHHAGAEGGQRRLRRRARPRRDRALVHERPEPHRQLPQGRPSRPLGRAQHGHHRDRRREGRREGAARSSRASSPARHPRAHARRVARDPQPAARAAAPPRGDQPLPAPGLAAPRRCASRSTTSSRPRSSRPTSSARTGAGIVDGLATIADGTDVVLYVWYDNEYGYCCQVVRVIEAMAGTHPVVLPERQPVLLARERAAVGSRVGWPQGSSRGDGALGARAPGRGSCLGRRRLTDEH